MLYKSNIFACSAIIVDTLEQARVVACQMMNVHGSRRLILMQQVRHGRNGVKFAPVVKPLQACGIDGIDRHLANGAREVRRTLPVRQFQHAVTRENPDRG